MIAKVTSSLLGLKRIWKNVIIISFDYILLTFSFWGSLSIRINEVYIPTIENNLLIIITPFVAIPIFYSFGLYKSIIRYSSLDSLITIMRAVSLYTFLWFLVVLSVDLVSKPYDFLIINWLLSTFLIGGIRYSAQAILGNAYLYKNVLIYGAGSAGIQLESALKYHPNYRVIGFIDKNKLVQGRYISGKKVFSSTDLSKLINRKRISEILIAIPSLSRRKRFQLLQKLKKHPVIIKSIPSLSDLTDGNVSISDLKKVKIEDLLQREVRKPIADLIAKDIKEKVILVSGAGGSIGSEICRQIIKLQPKKIILFDISEHALYQIERQILDDSPCELISIIGNVTNQNRLGRVIRDNKVDTVYHAAAYKHVPMVEKNFIAGVRCNIFGTLSCIQASIENNIESFVFISTDKAVRPTNIMGATKRFAELILQSKAQEVLKEKKTNTRISMVRFGNVLGSSGSVVPLFTEQIEKGGPVTVTDPNIIRYFMTIKEAAQLVIQAGSMGQAGDIFVLDMGEQVHVLDLAKDMIRLSGMTVADENNPDGDIEIVFTGLRPGEKLYEELLIDNQAEKTQHEKIQLVKDKGLLWVEMKKYIDMLEEAIKDENFDECKRIFSETVSGYSNIK
ncbi:polysaccharide biosynthesis protein [Gammaproteobacteria bacterium]|nr:polysaccharide biosynthesis protein [Gammaproteobacteria bacterium]